MWLVAVVALVAIVFLLLKPAGGGVKTVDAAGVDKAAAAGAQIIDVRSKVEFDGGHIPGAVNIPVETLQATAQGLDRNATYVVYCQTGARSAEAVRIMQSMGFKNIDHFSAGVVAYPPAKLVREQAGSPSDQKVPTNGKPVFVEFYTPG